MNARTIALGLMLSSIWAGCASKGDPNGSSGGAPGSGGAPASGGLPPVSGGAPANGGAPASGGAPIVTGGGGTAGAPSAGSAGLSTGGSAGGTATGGAAGLGGGGGGNGGAGNGGGGNGGGGASAGGVATGGVSTGGATSTPCTLTGSPNPGSGSFTYYYFGQGTYKNEAGKYQTACGYQGTGSGMTDTVENIASPNHFVAIPGQNPMNFENAKYCGGCVQLTNGGKSVVATIIDECPLNTNPLCKNGHLDVSKSAFDQLGYGVGNPSGTTWKFVPCPVKGNVKIRVKPGNMNEMYIENLFVALQSVTMDGTPARRQPYGAWHWDINIPVGAALALTDLAGRTVNVKVASIEQGLNQDTGAQFPTCQ